MDTWPITLQQCLNADDFQMDKGNAVVRTDMDVGPAKMRNRSTKSVDQYTGSIFAGLDALADLEDFYTTVLSHGTLPFLFTDPITNTQRTFRFIQPYSVRPLGGVQFRVSFKWERLG